MSTLERIVPPLELCKQIPEGEFKDSALVWVDGNTQNPDEVFVEPRRYAVDGTHRPAPTLDEILEGIRERGVNFSYINFGGGLGIDYQEPDEHPCADFKAYFNTFAEFFQPTPHLQVHFELGRSIVAQCGSLISTVLYVKEGKKRKFVVLDAGMNDLLRPALYQAYHKIENVTSRLPEEKYDVVGPVCESADCFGKDVTLPATRRGDMIAIRSCGAYGEAMASRYNLRDLAPAVYWASDQG